MAKLPTYNTVCLPTTSGGKVIHFTTVIVEWTDSTVTLRAGNRTPVSKTTKSRMNTASEVYGLGFRVWRKNFVDYVDTPHNGTIEFIEGMSFDR